MVGQLSVGTCQRKEIFRVNCPGKKNLGSNFPRENFIGGNYCPGVVFQAGINQE